MKREQHLSTVGLLSGLAAPWVFWSTLFICANTLGAYRHTSNMVSELGALGTVTQRTFTYGLVGCGALSLVLIATLFSRAKRDQLSVWPVLIMLTFPFSISCAGIFPYPTALHGTLGSPVVMLFLSPLLAMILWRSRECPSGLIPFGCLALIFFLGGFSTFFPDFLPGAMGLKQRAFHLGWSIWFAYLGVAFHLKSRTQGSAAQHP